MKRATDKTKKEDFEIIYGMIIEFQRTCVVTMYMKTRI